MSDACARRMEPWRGWVECKNRASLVCGDDDAGRGGGGAGPFTLTICRAASMGVGIVPCASHWCLPGLPDCMSGVLYAHA